MPIYLMQKYHTQKYIAFKLKNLFFFLPENWHFMRLFHQQSVSSKCTVKVLKARVISAITVGSPLSSSCWLLASVSPLPATEGRCWSWRSGPWPPSTGPASPLPRWPGACGSQRPWWGKPSPRFESSWRWSPGRRSSETRPGPGVGGEGMKDH